MSADKFPQTMPPYTTLRYIKVWTKSEDISEDEKLAIGPLSIKIILYFNSSERGLINPTTTFVLVTTIEANRNNRANCTFSHYLFKKPKPNTKG